jgi:erythronate-4-phosphate dehydrogenase
MIVVIDSKNPFLAEALSPACEVRVLHTPLIDASHLRDADAVIVRSETHVGPRLLEGTNVRFVGTATIGIDHVNTAWLQEQGIGFASAPGSNADSVAQYMAAALLVVAGKTGRTLRGSTLGVVGAGNVGSRVAGVGRAFGMNVILNDPPLARMTGDQVYRPLEELMEADVITLHVPLTGSGEDPTMHLWNAARIARMKHGSMLFNTARGPVVDGSALSAALVAGHLGGAVLDVWEREPSIDVGLLGHVLLGTPHIAGYSLDGKINAARMMFEALVSHFGLGLQWPEPHGVPPAGDGTVTVHTAPDEQGMLRGVVTRCYDIEQDDARLRLTEILPPDERAQAFRALRAEYPVRREFRATEVKAAGAPPAVVQTLRDLGFTVTEA